MKKHTEPSPHPPHPHATPWIWTHSRVRNMNGDVVCRGVAKAGDEDVRSMTLRRAGWPYDFDAALQ